MKWTVQVVTQTEHGEESVRTVACVERQELTPASLGLAIADSKAIVLVVWGGLSDDWFYDVIGGIVRVGSVGLASGRKLHFVETNISGVAKRNTH